MLKSLIFTVFLITSNIKQAYPIVELLNKFLFNMEICTLYIYNTEAIINKPIRTFK